MIISHLFHLKNLNGKLIKYKYISLNSIYMYTSKRVFTRDDNSINYHDYYKLKDGVQILKTIKSRDKLAVLNQFNSYESFQKLSSSYFPFIDNNSTELSYVKNIYNDNESFINKEKIVENNTMCKNVLYPYGKIVTKKNINQQFPTNIQLCNWCNEKPNKNIQPHNIDEIIIKKCNFKKKKHKLFEMLNDDNNSDNDTSSDNDSNSDINDSNSDVNDDMNTDINTADVNNSDVNDDMNTDINIADVNTADVNTADVNIADVNTADVNTADVNTADVNTVINSDVNTADVNTVINSDINSDINTIVNTAVNTAINTAINTAVNTAISTAVSTAVSTAINTNNTNNNNNNNNNNSNTEFVKIMKKFIKELNVKNNNNITGNLCEVNGSINKDTENEVNCGICKNKNNNCDIYERYNGSLKKNIPYLNDKDKEAKGCACKKKHNYNLSKKPKSLFI